MNTDKIIESGVNVLVAVLGLANEPKAVTVIKDSEDLIKEAASAVVTGDPKPVEMTSVVATTVSTLLNNAGQDRAASIIMMLVPALQMIIGDMTRAKIEGESITGEIDFTA